MKSFIELKKQREFGELLADTFAFIRNEFKSFFGAILKISGPYVALFLIAMVFYMYIVGDQFNFDLINTNQFYSSPSKLILAYLVYFGGAILAFQDAKGSSIHLKLCLRLLYSFLGTKGRQGKPLTPKVARKDTRSDLETLTF